MMKRKGNIESPALGCKVGRAYQVMLNQLSSALKEAGLAITTSEYLVLRAIYSREGLQQCEIADMVGKDKSAVCRCVDGLEKRGLVRTETESHKCRRVYLTEQSEAIEERVMEVAAKRHKALMDMTAPGDIEIFNRILENIISSK